MLIEVTLLGMVYAPVLPPGHWMRVVLVLLNNIPLSVLYAVLAAATFIAARLVLLAKAPTPILVTYPSKEVHLDNKRKQSSKQVN
jgi:hypothetical protein